MIKLMLLFLSCCMMLTPLYAKTADDTADGKLADVVVKEKDAFKIEKEKPPVSLSVDYMKAVLPTIKTDKYFLEGKADKPETDDLNIPFNFASKGTVSPWLYSLVSEPVVEFIFENDKIDAVSWTLIITDSRGKPFNVYTDKNPVPASIDWDGRDSSENFMLAGVPYSYIFEVTNEQGNTQTSIGKPFTINAVVHQENEDLFINLSLKALFETKKNGLGLSQTGSLLLAEVSDIIKEYFDSHIIIKLYSENKELADNQAKIISSYITDALLMPKEWITIEGYATAPENYQAEIISSSRKHPGWEYKDFTHNKLIIAVETPVEEHLKTNRPAAPADKQ